MRNYTCHITNYYRYRYIVCKFEKYDFNAHTASGYGLNFVSYSDLSQ